VFFCCVGLLVWCLVLVVPVFVGVFFWVCFCVVVRCEEFSGFGFVIFCGLLYFFLLFCFCCFLCVCFFVRCFLAVWSLFFCFVF